ncbi:MAG: LamG domain-containing protein [Candidatus Omnitrophica bacterium]|nr:LamG domain-containing protein [Candidatus Omnitrophota bacterium]
MKRITILLFAVLLVMANCEIYGYLPHESEINDQGSLGIPGAGYAYGVRSHAGSFNGDDYVTVSDDPSLKPNNAVTASAWVKLNSLGGPILHKSNWNDYVIWHDGNGYFGHVIIGGQAVSVWSPISTIPGEWDHVAISYDGSAVKLYVNGKEVDSNPASGTINHGGSRPEFQVGRYTGASGESYYMNGQVDEVQVYERGLIGTEVSQMYEMGLRGLPTGIDPTGRVLHIDFDGDTNDRSDYGNNGTLITQ